MKLYCACCGKEIEHEYIKVLDNYLQVKYFDNDECNCFCSKDCLCDYIMAETFEILGEEDESNISNRKTSEYV